MMTTNEIIEMARQVGVDATGNEYWPFFIEELERFAKLVAEKAHEECGLPAVGILERTVARAVAKEREACAKVCEELPAPDIYNNTDQSMWDVTCMDCSTAIRARGEA